MNTPAEASTLLFHWHPSWTAGVALHGAQWLLAGAILAWLLVAEPWLGRAGFRRFLQALERGDETARIRFYRAWTLQAWLFMLVALAAAFLVFGWTPSQLGLRVPHMTGHPARGFVGGLVGGLVGALLAGLVLGIVMGRRSRTSTPAPVRPVPEAFHMLPRSAAERRGFALLAVTAGLTEEVIWRGMLLALLVAAFPAAPIAVPVLAMALAFGWAHLYQGAGGVLSTALIGVLLTALYLATGSLLVPMLVHVAIDLLAMLRAPRRVS